MRMIILSALMGLGIGLAGIPAANAAPMSGLSSTAMEGTLLQDAQYYRGDRHYRRDRRWRRPHCRSVQVCRRGPYGRRCHIERICRR